MWSEGEGLQAEGAVSGVCLESSEMSNEETMAGKQRAKQINRKRNWKKLSYAGR